jgi:hypothetical protein
MYVVKSTRCVHAKRGKTQLRLKYGRWLRKMSYAIDVWVKDTKEINADGKQNVE